MFPIIRGDLVLLLAEALTQFVEDLASIDELHFAFALCPLVLGEYPDVGSDPGVVEQVYRQGNDRLDEVLFQQPPADLALTGGYSTGVERTAVLDDGGPAALGIHLVYG